MNSSYKPAILSIYILLSLVAVIIVSYKPISAVIIVVAIIVGAIFTTFLSGKFTAVHYTIILIPSIILSPIINIPGFPISIRLDDLWMAFGAVLLVAHAAKNKNLKVYFPRYAWVYVLFIFWIAVTIFLSTYREPHFYSISDWTEVYKNLKLLIYLLIVTNLVLEIKDLKKIVSVLIGSLLVSAVFGIMQYLNLFGVNSLVTPYYIFKSNVYGLEMNSRVVGTFGNPNIFGFALLVGIALSLSELFKTFKLRYAISLFIFFIALTMTQSRTALVTGIALVIIISFMTIWKTRKKIKTFALISLIPIIGVFALQYAPRQFFFRIGRLGNVSEDTSLNARFGMWENIYYTRTKGNEIFGTGPTSGIRITFDNEWLMLLTLYGVVGVTLFILMFSLIYFKLGKVDSGQLNFYNIAAKGLILIFGICMWMSDIFTLLQVMPIVIILIGLTLNPSVNGKSEQGHWGQTPTA